MTTVLTLYLLFRVFAFRCVCRSNGCYPKPIVTIARSVFGFITKQIITYRSRYANDPLLLKTIVCGKVPLLI